MININVGILGHVDSGKTSLVKALSTALSTAALDKHPESRRRGITLDLGFSSFIMEIPDHLQDKVENGSQLQFTLVDCPGHASLIRTIIGGAQIIDMIVLVIDINKGIQTQTAECIVLGEITTNNMIIVLNKVDMIAEESKELKINKMINKINKIFSTTKFPNPIIVLTAAAVGGEKVAAVSSTKEVIHNNTPIHTVDTYGIDNLLDTIRNNIQLPHRNVNGSFYYAIDHCFAIKGHGTVLTGTVLKGSVSLNAMIELPELQIQRKVKSLQMFRKPVKEAQQGDRVAICVTNLDPELIERGIASSPDSVPLIRNAICLVRKIRFYKMACKSNTNFHISIGHLTVLANVIFFGEKELRNAVLAPSSCSSDPNSHESKSSSSGATISGEDKGRSSDDEYIDSRTSNFPKNVVFNMQDEFEYQEELHGSANPTDSISGILPYGQESLQWMFIQFQQPVYCPSGSLVIASKLETESKAVLNDPSLSCRLAFFGPIHTSIPQVEDEVILPKLKLYRWKQRECEIHRVVDVRHGLCHEAIGWKLYSKEAGIKNYVGLKLETEAGKVIGVIQGAFGATDKFRIHFPGGAAEIHAGMKLIMRYKRYVFDSQKVMRQTGIECEEKDVSHGIDMSSTTTTTTVTTGNAQASISTIVNDSAAKIIESTEAIDVSPIKSNEPKAALGVSDLKTSAAFTSKSAVVISKDSVLKREAAIPSTKTSVSAEELKLDANKVSTSIPTEKYQIAKKDNDNNIVVASDMKKDNATTKVRVQATAPSVPVGTSSVWGIFGMMNPNVKRDSSSNKVDQPSALKKSQQITSQSESKPPPSPPRPLDKTNAFVTAQNEVPLPAKSAVGASNSKDNGSVRISAIIPRAEESKSMSTPSTSAIISTKQTVTSLQSKPNQIKNEKKATVSQPIINTKVINKEKKIDANFSLPPPLVDTSLNRAIPPAVAYDRSQVREGIVESIKSDGDGYNIAIVSGAFTMEENIRSFGSCLVQIDQAMAMNTSTATGELVGPFAKLGKCKVKFLETNSPNVNAKVLIYLTKNV